MGWVFNATLQPLYPRERPGTHCIGGWVDPVWTDGENLAPHWNSNPGPSSLQRVAIPSTLSRPTEDLQYQIENSCVDKGIRNRKVGMLTTVWSQSLGSSHPLQRNINIRKHRTTIFSSYLFWDVLKTRLVVYYHVSGKTYRSHLQVSVSQIFSWTRFIEPEVWTIGGPKSSILDSGFS